SSRTRLTLRTTPLASASSTSTVSRNGTTSTGPANDCCPALLRATVATASARYRCRSSTTPRTIVSGPSTANVIPSTTSTFSQSRISYSCQGNGRQDRQQRCGDDGATVKRE